MHGLEQLEAGVEPGQEAGLQRALLEFLGGAAVDRDAGADAETPPPGAGVAAGQRQRADRHRQAEVTTGTPGRRGVEPADGAGVEAPRGVFEGSDDLHRAVLRCTGDRSARKQRPHQIREAGAGRQPGVDGRGHLEHGLVGLDREQGRYRHAAGLGDAAEVVAQQVDDHQVLSAVLGIFRQHPGDFAVTLGDPRARRRALHRPRRQPAIVMLEEQLRRTRQHVARPLARRQRDEGAEAHRLAGAQAAVERHRGTEGGKVEAVGVIDLIGLTGGDRGVDLRDRLFEGGAIHARHQVEGTGRRRPAARLAFHVVAVRRLAMGQPGRRSGLVEPREVFEQQESQAAGVGLGNRLVAGSEQAGTPLVVGQHHRVQAFAEGGVERRTDRVEVGRIVAAQFAPKAGVEPAVRRRRGCGAVVEQGEAVHGAESNRAAAAARWKRAQVLQSSMSWRMTWRLAISSSIVGSLARARRIASLVAS